MKLQLSSCYSCIDIRIYIGWQMDHDR